MAEFQFVDQEPDLLELTLEGERVCLVTISGEFEEAIFSEFTSDITRYMFPKPADDIGETRAFIADSLQGMKEGNNVQLVIVCRDDGEFLGCCGLHGGADVEKPELGSSKGLTVTATGSRRFTHVFAGRERILHLTALSILSTRTTHPAATYLFHSAAGSSGSGSSKECRATR